MEEPMARIIAIALFVIALPCVAVVAGGELMTAIAPRQIPEKPPLMGRWRGYTKEAVASYWSKLDAESLDAEKRFLEVDLIFPFVYGGAVLTGMLVAWNSRGLRFSPAIFVGLVAAMMLADWVENLVHLRELSAFEAGGATNLSSGWIVVASAATITKWAMVSTSAITVLALAVAVVFQTPRGD
jgi:hypothetical protein